MEKLNPIHEIITKQVVNENCEYVLIRKGNLIVTDRKIMVIQPLKYYSIPEEQILLLEGKAFSKESFREIQKADELTFKEDGVYCSCKSGTVKKKIFYQETDVNFEWDYLLELAKNIKPCDGIGIKAEYYVKLSKCMLNYSSDFIKVYQIEHTNLKVIKDENYEDQYAFLVA